jgi:hypothetical protein
MLLLWSRQDSPWFAVAVASRRVPGALASAPTFTPTFDHHWSRSRGNSYDLLSAKVLLQLTGSLLLHSTWLICNGPKRSNPPRSVPQLPANLRCTTATLSRRAGRPGLVGHELMVGWSSARSAPSSHGLRPAGRAQLQL